MSETLREFVVGLGYTVDDSGRDKFEGALLKATTLGNLLATSLEGMAKNAVAGFSAFVEGYEKLYDISRRSGQSVESINSFKFAMSQLGSSSEDATSAVQALIAAKEKFGAKNYSSMMHTILGVDPNSKTLFEDIAKSVEGLDQPMARAKLNFLGFSDSVIQGLRQSREATGFMEQYKKILRETGADQEGGARAAKLLSQQWRDLGAVVENILMKAFTTFAGEGGAGGAMREFIAWLEPKSGSIANGLNRIAQDAIAAGKKVVQFVIDIGEGATTWQEFTTKADHAATEIERLAAALGKILDFGDKVGRALRTVAEAISAVATSMGAIKINPGDPGWFGSKFDQLYGWLGGGGGGGVGGVGAGPGGATGRVGGGGGTPMVGGGHTTGGRAIAGQRPGWGAMSDMEVQAAIKEEFARKGLDPKLGLGIYRGEGRSAYVGDQGTSFGAFQLHNAPGGRAMGDEAVKAGINIQDPATTRQQIAFVADLLRAHPERLREFHGFHGLWAGSSGGGETARAAPPVAPAPETASIYERMKAIGERLGVAPASAAPAPAPFALPAFARPDQGVGGVAPLTRGDTHTHNHTDNSIHHSPSITVQSSGGGGDEWSTARDVSWAVDMGHRRLMSDLMRNLPNNAAQ